MLPSDPKAALAVKQIEARPTALWMQHSPPFVSRQGPPPSSQKASCCASEKISRSLDMCEKLIREGKIHTDSWTATIAIACAIGYLNFRRVSRLVR